MSAHWSLGVLIGLPIAGVLALLCVLAWIAATLFWWSERKDNYGFTFFATLIPIGVLILVAGITAWAFYPFSAQYHRWVPKSGVVTDVSSRFLSQDKGTTQKFVVEFANDPEQRYGCNDTRCSLVKEGDTLTLSCKRTWQYAGEDGWDCNYVRAERA